MFALNLHSFIASFSDQSARSQPAQLETILPQQYLESEVFCGASLFPPADGFGTLTVRARHRGSGAPSTDAPDLAEIGRVGRGAADGVASICRAAFIATVDAVRKHFALNRLPTRNIGSVEGRDARARAGAGSARAKTRREGTRTAPR
jgi:hypothetical protein